jgi:hypothetical protein
MTFDDSFPNETEVENPEINLGRLDSLTIINEMTEDTKEDDLCASGDHWQIIKA